MTAAFEQLESEALKLDRNERIILGQELLVSAMTQEETEIEKAWYDEAERRLAAYKAGKVKTYPADQVINDAISKLG
jgi:putative addiction module component (TIGR02574 family)